VSFFAHYESGQGTGYGLDKSRASERMHRALFERNPQPIWLYDRASMRIVAVNDAARLVYGYSRDEFLSMSPTDLLPADDVADYLKGLPPLDATEPIDERSDAGFRQAVPRRHRYKDGSVVDVESTYTDLLLDDRPCRIVLSQNVTERNRAVSELAAAHDEAVEALNTKSAFLANISHEIRTPMNAVLGMTELLLHTDLDEDQRSLAIQVASSGKLMIELLSDILDISKIEAGQLSIRETEFGLRKTIERACAAVRPHADARDVALELTISEDVPQRTLGDGQRLLQVLLNVLANAVKFTSEGAVTVDATTRPREDESDLLRIEVTDTGLGIETSTIEAMFEPFTQADTSPRRRYGGTGLGLAIARELIELMGGSIGAVSSLGRGSTFWIELPLATAVATPLGSIQRAAERTPIVDRPWSNPPLVLVVEDSPVNEVVAVRTLERCGCLAEAAGDGQQALEMLSTRQYDAVLMDCQMPGMDGYMATAELRRRESGLRHTPVIAMTAHATTNDRERCLDAGMDDYISKPIEHEQLIEILDRWILPRASMFGARGRSPSGRRRGQQTPRPAHLALAPREAGLGG
jgi:PAS domain S-box-containing protein